MSWKGFNGSKNNRTATEQIAYESLVAGSGTIILHPGMDTGDDLTNRALVPMQKNIVQALDMCVTLSVGGAACAIKCKLSHVQPVAANMAELMAISYQSHQI